MRKTLKYLFCTVVLALPIFTLYSNLKVKDNTKVGYVLAKNDQDSVQTEKNIEEKLRFNFSLFSNIEQQQIKTNDEFLRFVINRLKSNYVEELDEEKLYESAINGVLSSLDPHSRYMNKKEYKEMQENLRGEFGGLGIVVTKNTDFFITVISPIEDTPAFKAGIKSGDYISQINDKSTFNMELHQAVDMMRGKVGEKVKIVVLRKGETKPLEFILKREKIKTNPVKGNLINGNIMYIKITEFKDNLQQDTMNLFNKLKPKLDKEGLKGLILDLRNNPGGLLSEATSLAELFLDKDKVVVSTKGRTNSLSLYKTKKGNILIDKNVPLVVLVNSGSASASEIIAGAVQDYKRGFVLGTKTFGKASVQTVFPLMNGGAMLITTARYYTPSNRSIQLEGIEPDIVVKQGKIDFEDNKYENFNEGSLKGHLKREDDKEDIVAKTIKENSKDKKENKEDYSNDYQLSRAISLIEEINFVNDKQRNDNSKKTVVKNSNQQNNQTIKKELIEENEDKKSGVDNKEQKIK